jgi:type II secretory pathway component PulF
MIAFLPIDLLSLKALLLLAGWIVFFVVGNYGLYFLLSLPMRRQERARLFLDLLDHALANGRPLEEAIQSVGRCRDRALGARFHLLAAHMERGLNFEQALAKVPTLLPPVVTEMLRLGREAGDLRRVLPACQRMIRDHASQVRKAQSYVIVLLLVVSPVALTVLGFLRVYVFPKFEAIFADMLERTPQEFNLLVAYEPLWLAGYVFFCGLIWTGTFLYLGGPRADRMLHAMFGNLYDAFLLRLPWRRQRVQRDFAAMLGAPGTW